MKPGTIIHVAETGLNEGTGMGRVALHWKKACERRGHKFIHIGPEEAGRVAHRALFPRAAYSAWRAMKTGADLFLVHEPASGTFVRRGIPAIAFSHGLERRGWELMRGGHPDWNAKPSLKTRLLFPLWRLRNCDAGLRGADGVLLINQEDARYATRRYGIGEDRIRVFRNGVYPATDREESNAAGKPFTVLFTGSWVARKGVRTLARAAEALWRKGVEVAWILAGTAIEENEVLAAWPAALRPVTTVIPRFAPREETGLLNRSHLFVLPSFFEGQPLVLLQAMEAGLCCIATDCCGQKDLIRDRRNGLLFEPGDSDALARLVAECAADETLRRSLGAAARDSVSGRTWDAVADETALQIESMMTGGRFAP